MISESQSLSCVFGIQSPPRTCLQMERSVHMSLAWTGKVLGEWVPLSQHVLSARLASELSCPWAKSRRVSDKWTQPEAQRAQMSLEGQTKPSSSPTPILPLLAYVSILFSWTLGNDWIPEFPGRRTEKELASWLGSLQTCSVLQEKWTLNICSWNNQYVLLYFAFKNHFSTLRSAQT